MKERKHFSGYVVQSKEMNPLIADENDKYRGISRFVNWPLEGIQDNEARYLSDAAYNTWFCFDSQMWFIPDLSFIVKYNDCCIKEGISTRIVFVEDTSNTLFRKNPVNGVEEYGYDYSGGDLSVSLLYSDLFDTLDPAVKDTFRDEAKRLNQYGLFSTYHDAFMYVNARKKKHIPCLEQIYAPEIIRISIALSLDKEDQKSKPQSN